MNNIREPENILGISRHLLNNFSVLLISSCLTHIISANHLSTIEFVYFLFIFQLVSCIKDPTVIMNNMKDIQDIQNTMSVKTNPTIMENVQVSLKKRSIEFSKIKRLRCFKVHIHVVGWEEQVGIGYQVCTI